MSKNRILIVEDDTYIAENIGINLDMSGYDYTIMTDGLCAANHLKNDHSYDLALLDIMLPGMDGFALMEYMQKYNIPVLYLTAKSDLPSRIKGLRDGAEDYIVKPFEMLELLVRMEKILERTGKLHTILRYRDITIDTEKRIVTKCGEAVALQPLEFDLLVMLGQFTRNYTQTVKRAADNKRRYAPGEGSIPPVLLSGVSKGVPPLAHDFACKV